MGCTKKSNEKIEIKPIKLPKGKSIENPFFAYGIFKKNQLAYSKIKKYVRGNPISVTIPRQMLMRDGIPVIKENDDKYYETKGDLIYFKDGEEKNAYDEICKTEPDILYKWQEIKIGEVKANVLVGVTLDGSHIIEDENELVYNGKNDPFFKELIEILEDYLKPKPKPKPKPKDEIDQMLYELSKNKRNERPEKIFFELQMYYMLLWSAIERYCSLKYDIKNSINTNNKLFANEKSFQKSLKVNVKRKGRVYSSKDARVYELNPDCPEESIRYYYTIRCNAVHRGKSVRSDKMILKDSLEELLKIFKDVRDDTFDDDNIY